MITAKKSGGNFWGNFGDWEQALKQQNWR